MSENTSEKSLVPLGKSDLVLHGREGNKLIQRAASDALVTMNSMMNQMETILHRVGSHEFHDEDFQQLQVWAAELGMEGRVADFVEAFDRFFMDLVSQSNDFVMGFTKDNRTEWCCNGRIKVFVEFGRGTLSSPRLPKLEGLCWIGMWSGSAYFPLKKLDLSSVPALTHLYCDNNQLTELDLFSVPALTELSCDNNQLTELDLSSVPALTHLYCSGNQLTGLELSSAPLLTALFCYNNQLSALDLSSVPALKALWCDGNQLTELDLFAVPDLTALFCENNQLTELDLSAVPDLKRLKCANNRLTELDIRGCFNLKNVTVDPCVVVHKRSDQTVRRRGSR